MGDRKFYFEFLGVFFQGEKVSKRRKKSLRFFPHGV
jgi:hypothetical protein